MSLRISRQNIYRPPISLFYLGLDPFIDTLNQQHCHLLITSQTTINAIFRIIILNKLFKFFLGPQSYSQPSKLNGMEPKPQRPNNIRPQGPRAFQTSDPRYGPVEARPAPPPAHHPPAPFPPPQHEMKATPEQQPPQQQQAPPPQQQQQQQPPPPQGARLVLSF